MWRIGRSYRTPLHTHHARLPHPPSRTHMSVIGTRLRKDPQRLYPACTGRQRDQPRCIWMGQRATRRRYRGRSGQGRSLFSRPVRAGSSPGNHAHQPVRTQHRSSRFWFYFRYSRAIPRHPIPNPYRHGCHAHCTRQCGFSVPSHLSIRSSGQHAAFTHPCTWAKSYPLGLPHHG